MGTSFSSITSKTSWQTSFKLILDLVAIFGDGSNVILVTLRLRSLDQGDDPQANTATVDYDPVGSPKEVLFVQFNLIAELRDFVSQIRIGNQWRK